MVVVPLIVFLLVVFMVLLRCCKASQATHGHLAWRALGGTAAAPVHMIPLDAKLSLVST